MIYNDLLVSITNLQGEPLEEFKQVETGENSVECWIPSKEGSGFQIHWQPIRNFKPGLGLHCAIKFDGKGVSSGQLKSTDISRGLPGIKTGMTVAKGVKRHYVFGRHNITGTPCTGAKYLPSDFALIDREDLALPDDPGRESMATIQITLSWVKYGKKQRRHGPYPILEGPRFVHECAVKKGHLGTVTLGAPVPKSHSRGRIREKEDIGFPKVVFLFRYGPRDWLEAKDIIATERYLTQDFKPKPAARVVKQERETTTTQSIPETLRSHTSRITREQGGEQSDVIDIDDLESDDGSDVVVLNDLVTPKSSTSITKTET
ncbi:unnamed protein product [Rhizoctonia solani]|uniref:DUF7918 domain-containing protein n=1 Tax=Rhizoctonia solani TaxID=456999 RepID=A0A8H3D5W2_9AGAM|nr:unnamed protein product [Rhizoctonia solani]